MSSLWDRTSDLFGVNADWLRLRLPASVALCRIALGAYPFTCHGLEGASCSPARRKFNSDFVVVLKHYRRGSTRCPAGREKKEAAVRLG